MEFDGGDANCEAGENVAYAVAVGVPEVDRFTDTEMLRQFQPLR